VTLDIQKLLTHARASETMSVSKTDGPGDVPASPAPDIRTELMPVTTVTHALYRVHPDGSTEPVSTHPDFSEGWSAGTSAVHADREHFYLLYRGRTRVARFAHARAVPRVSVSNLDALALIGAGS
jgi:hypothetical protein